MPRVSNSANRGIQETPVDALATGGTPQAMRLSARASRAAGQGPTRRTGGGAPPGGTAPPGSAAPMSRPAACGGQTWRAAERTGA